MLHFYILTDVSVDTKLKVGYGAYLVLSDLGRSIESLKDLVKVKRFEQTSSTKLELQTFLWALEETIALVNNGDIALTIYTDSQNIIGLPDRRSRLEQNDYFSSKNKKLSNYQLYQQFYQVASNLNCVFIKVAGHKAFIKKNEIEKLFSLVDQASRRALREYFQSAG